METDEACTPLPPAQMPLVFWVGDELTRVSLDSPAHEPRSGACSCGACLAVTLAEARKFV